jgi:hypothetical protein
MTVFHVKSTPVTNADAVPVTANTAGEGGSAPLKVAEGSAVVTAAASIDSTIQLVRVPSTAKIKMLNFETAAQTAGQIDIGVYYATDGLGGRPLTLLASQAVDQDFFASAVIVTAAVTITNVTNESTTYTVDKRVQPLWQAAGLTVDPGGNLDIVATVVAVDITTGAGRMGLTAYYTD